VGNLHDMLKLTFWYTLFALVATLANIGSQDITTRVYQGRFDITLSILVGTAVGLLVKYVLDKKYIFKYRVANLAHDTRMFLLYTAMGIITTLIFWAFEFGFEYLFETKAMRYLGGVIGLCIGYLVKYQLDRRYVFSVVRPE
jgi:putative flippase GtrA